MRAHLRTSATAGMVVGMVVGVSEAIAAAGADDRLPPGAEFWVLWAVTVGIYSALGAALFGVFGLLGAAASLLRRIRYERLSHPYCALGAATLPVYFIVRHTDLRLPGDVLALFSAKVAAVSIVLGAIAWLAARFLSTRRGVGTGAVHGVVVGYLAAGGVWARCAPNGVSALEKAGAVAAGVVLCLAVCFVSEKLRRNGCGHLKRAALPRYLILWPIPFVLLVGLAGMRIAFPSPPRGAPNVVLVTVDALRADRLGCYGNAGGLSPEVDRLARESVVFDNAFTAAPWTAPSVASLLESRFPSEVGLWPGGRRRQVSIHERGIRTSEPTLAEALRSAGYVTAAEVANANLSRHRGYARGFVTFRSADELDADEFAAEALALPRLRRYGDWFVHTSIGQGLASAAHDYPRYFAAPGIDIYDGEWLVRDALGWLRRERRRPLLLWMHLLDVHQYASDPRRTSHATAALFPHPPFEPRPRLLEDRTQGRVVLSAEGKDYLRALYGDGVRYADRWLGFLIANLRELGLYQDALVIVTADHGEELGEHGRFGHARTVYDEVLRVPLLVKFPRGAHAGTRVRAPVGLIDIMPTVLDVAGLPIPRGVRGRTLLTLVGKHEGSSGERELYAESTPYAKEEFKALRTARYKAIFHTRSHAMEVYDLVKDPHERRDLAGERRVAPELRKRLLQLARESDRRTAEWARLPRKRWYVDERVREQLSALGYAAP